MQIEYRFHEMGYSIDEDKVEDGHVWLDIGNALKNRVIDHHTSEKKYSCNLKDLIDNPHLVEKLLDKEIIVLQTQK